MNVFLLTNYLVYLLYIVTYFGLWSKAPQYLDYLRTLLKMYVGMVLILTFNPFIQLSSSGMNRQIAFSAGIFVLTGLSLDNVYKALNPVFSGLISL